jgi:protease-4
MGSFTKQMTPQERAIFQGLVDDSFGRFKDIVQSGRPAFRGDEGRAKLDQVATGQIFTSSQAKDQGLVDEVGYLEEAIGRAIELAGADKQSIRVVEYERPMSLTDVLIGARAQPPAVDLSALANLSAPRAYYLTTLLPAWMISSEAGR